MFTKLIKLITDIKTVMIYNIYLWKATLMSERLLNRPQVQVADIICNLVKVSVEADYSRNLELCLYLKCTPHLSY